MGPVKFGSYEADQDDQEPMGQLISLIQLKKVGRLIDLLARVGKPLDAGSSSLHATLASWLSSELNQTVKEIGKGAKSAVRHPS